MNNWLGKKSSITVGVCLTRACAQNVLHDGQKWHNVTFIDWNLNVDEAETSK